MGMQPGLAESSEGLRILSELQGHTSFIHQVSWSDRQTWLASASSDCTVRIWDLDTESEKAVLSHRRAVFAVAWSPDGQQIASGGADGVVNLWDAQSAEHANEFHGHSEDVYCLAWSPDGQYLASGSDDSTIYVWDSRTGERLFSLKNHTNTIYGVAWSPDGRHLASAAADRSVLIWEPKPSPAVRILGSHLDEVNALVWSSDSTLLASGSDDGFVQIWNPQQPDSIHVLEGHTGSITALSFSGDDRLMVSRSKDNSLRIWRTDYWIPVSVINLGTGDWYTGAAFCRTRPWLAAPTDDFTIRIWEYDTEKLLSRKASQEPEKFRSAKVVLLGEARAGKTCLARALMDKPFQHQDATHGMNIDFMDIQEIQEIDGSFTTQETVIWDLAGQFDYKIVHQMFLDQTSVAVLVFDATDPESVERAIDTWDTTLERLLSSRSRKILVAAGEDRGPQVYPTEYFENLSRRFNYDAYHSTSAKTGKGIRELRNGLRKLILWSNIPIVHSSRLWKELRNFLLNQSAAYNLRRRSGLEREFRAKKSERQFSSAEFNDLIDKAARQGLVATIPPGNLLLLRPELLNDYASSIIRAARRAKDGTGSLPEKEIFNAEFDLSHVQRIADRAAEIGLIHFVVRLMIEGDILIRESGRLLFPSQLTKVRADDFVTPPPELVIRFSGDPEKVYASVVCRLTYVSAFEAGALWRDVAEYRDSLGNTCVIRLFRTHSREHWIEISFSPETPGTSRDAFAYLVYEQAEMASVPGSIIREHLYRCKSCGEEFARRAVQHRIESGMKEITCQYCDHETEVRDTLLEMEQSEEGLRYRKRLSQTADTTKREVIKAVLAETERALNVARESVFDRASLAESSPSDYYYEDILEIIEEFGLAMERSPEPYAEMGEDNIRDLIVAQLKGHYKGRVTAETFSNKGKTDIFVDLGDEKKFIAECKFWDGPKKYGEAIDQLFGYTCWSDTKTAIIIFDRKRYHTANLKKIEEETCKHPLFREKLQQKSDSHRRYRFRHPSDESRDLYVAVLAVRLSRLQ